MSQLVTQSIGFIAAFFIIFSFQKNKRKLILSLFFIGQLLFVIHFGLLGAWTAVGMNIIAALRTFIFNQKEPKSRTKNNFWLYSFILLFWIAGILIWEGYSSLLLIAASTAESYALWKSNTKHIRLLMLIPRPFFFTYNFIVGSYGGMLTEAIVFISVIIGIIRFDVLKKPKNEIKN